VCTSKGLSVYCNTLLQAKLGSCDVCRCVAMGKVVLKSWPVLTSKNTSKRPDPRSLLHNSIMPVLMVSALKTKSKKPPKHHRKENKRIMMDGTKLSIGGIAGETIPASTVTLEGGVFQALAACLWLEGRLRAPQAAWQGRYSKRAGAADGGGRGAVAKVREGDLRKCRGDEAAGLEVEAVILLPVG
jgi:hypothetical protein